MSKQSLVGRVVKVVWDDAWQGEYCSHEDLGRLVPKTLSSYGFCVRDDREALVICMDEMSEHNQTDSRVRDFKFIPRRYVVKVEVKR